MLYVWGAFAPSYVWGSFSSLILQLSPIPPLEVSLMGAVGVYVGFWMGSEFVDAMLKSHKYFNALSLIESTPPRQNICPNWFGTP